MIERRRRPAGAGALHRQRRRGWSFLRIVGATYLAAVLLLALAAPALAQEVEITSAGPLTRIIVTSELNCQVAHRDDLSFEFFGEETGACGTFLAVEGSLFGPSEVPAAGFLALTPWTGVSQTPVAGSGSSGDPLRIVTVADAGATGLRVEQTDSYVVGSQSYRTDVRISNQGPAGRTGILYRAGDCFLQESDVGFGRVDSGAPACVISPAEGSRIEQWLPISAGSHYMEGGFTDVWAAVGAQQLLPDTCACDESVDNGAGLSWSVDIPAGQSVIVSHETFFSPVGRAPAQESFLSSVPDPTKISLDPVIVVQSVAIAAGVMLLIPFPSAIFNSTLEEHYDEVMAGVARIRARMAAFGAWIVAQVRRRVAARRQPGPSGGPPASQLPAAEAAAPSVEFVPTPEPTLTPSPTGDQSPSPTVADAPPTSTDKRTPRDLWRTPQGMALFILASALVYAFVDPTFGFSLTSVATFVGLAIGLAIVTLAYGIPLLVYARTHGIRVLVRALPATILVGVGCVIVSRLADFQPGYVYGLIIGFLFATKVGAEQEGRGEALAGAVTLAAAVIAWFSLAAIRASGADSGDLGAVALQTAAVTVVVAGLEGAVFAMLPLRFLPGGAVYAWNRRVWLVLIGLGVFGFAHVLLNPQTGYIADETRTSFLTMVLLLVGFGLVSVLFWAWFRFRPARRLASE